MADTEYQELPATVQAAVEAWVNALRAADGLAEDVLTAARESGVKREDIRALARRKLADTYRRTNHLAIGY